jgi:hypothetical protein
VRGRQLVLDLANQLLAMDIDPVPRYLLLRDVIRLPENSTDLHSAKQAIYQNYWVQYLIAQQRPDGGWGRFHGADVRDKPHVYCTSSMVIYGLTLGLNLDDRVFQKCLSYLEGLYKGEVPWPAEEREERNERWPIFKRVWFADAIARLDPTNSVIDREWETWVEIARRASTQGIYDTDEEQKALINLFGTRAFKGRPPLHHYALTLIAVRLSQLDSQLERTIFAHAWERGWHDLPSGDFTVWPVHWLPHWFDFQIELSQYPSWRSAFKPTAEKLLAHSNTIGLWDFGSKARKKIVGSQLSASWRTKTGRMVDHSTIVLKLLAICFQE